MTETRKKYWFFTRNWVKEENVQGNTEFLNGLRGLLREWILRERHAIIFQTERGDIRILDESGDTTPKRLARSGHNTQQHPTGNCPIDNTMPELPSTIDREPMQMPRRGIRGIKRNRMGNNIGNDLLDVLPANENHDENTTTTTMQMQEKKGHGKTTTGSNHMSQRSNEVMVGTGGHGSSRILAHDGNLHWQGVLILHSKRTRRTLRAHTKGCPLDGANWAPCRSISHAVGYVTKDRTKLDGPYWWGVGVEELRPPEEPLDYYNQDQATEWQRDLLARISTQCAVSDRRRINWFWSRYGGVGKSTIARHIVGFSFAGRSILIGGERRDAFYALTARAQKTKTTLEVVVVNLPRANVQRNDDGVEFASVSTAALEGISNGIFFNSKYECADLVLPRPVHIIVFANAPPDKSKMSTDRWHITQILTQADLGENPSEY